MPQLVALPGPPERDVAAERATRHFNRRPAPHVEAPAAVAQPAPAVQGAKPAKPNVKPVKKQQAATKPVTRKAAGSKPKKPKRALTVEAAPVGVPESGRVAAVLGYARAQIGKRYVWATAGPTTFDCSGLVLASYARVGIKLPHQSGAIAARGRRVPAGQWQPGDVLVMPGHVALYLGGGRMVEAANPDAGVRIAATRGGYAVRFL